MYENIKWQEIGPRPKCHIFRVYARLTRTGSDETDETFYEQMVRLHVPWSQDRPISKQEDQSWHSLYIRYNLDAVIAEPLDPIYLDDEDKKELADEVPDRNQS